MADQHERMMRCAVCRVSCQARGHKYTHGHAAALNRVLSGMKDKITAAKHAMRDISVIAAAPQRSADRKSHIPTGSRAIWCYFCECEVDKHTTIGDVVLQFGNSIEHFASSEHAESVAQFWTRHSPADQWDQGAFIIDAERYDRYLPRLQAKLEAVLLASEQGHQANVQTILEQDQARAAVLVSAAATSNTLAPQRVQPREGFAGMQTVDSKGHSLTRIHLAPLAIGEVNVHTPDHVPPWLQSSFASNQSAAGQSTATMIGPSLHLFAQHKDDKFQAKYGANSLRLGAHLDRALPADDSFLPNFGGVWHSHSRSAYKQAFTRNEFHSQRPTQQRQQQPRSNLDSDTRLSRSQASHKSAPTKEYERYSHATPTLQPLASHFAQYSLHPADITPSTAQPAPPSYSRITPDTAPPSTVPTSFHGDSMSSDNVAASSMPLSALQRTTHIAGPPEHDAPGASSKAAHAVSTVHVDEQATSTNSGSTLQARKQALLDKINSRKRKASAS